MQKFNVIIHGMQRSSNSTVIPYTYTYSLFHKHTYFMQPCMHTLTRIFIHIQLHKCRHTVIHIHFSRDALAQSRKSPECLSPKANIAII